MLIHDYMRRGWVVPEATFRTELAFTATDGFDFEEIKIHGMQEYSELRSHVGTGSLQGEVAERMANTWEATAYLAPGALGVAPDVGEILKHAYGNETISGGVSVTYAFSDLLSTLVGLQITVHASDNHLHQMNGAWVEQVQITVKSGEEARYTFSGGFADYAMLLQGAELVGVEATGQTVLSLKAGHAKLVRAGVFVKFTGDDNGGAGYLVTLVDTALDEITITPSLAGGGLVADDQVLPNVPGQTLTGTVQGGINCGLTIGGTAVEMIEATTTIDTGIRGVNDEATTEGPSRIARGRRNVSSEIVTYYDDVTAFKQAQAWQSDLEAIVLRAGPDTAAARVKQNFPNARIGHITDDFEYPEDSGARMTLPIKAQQNAAGADEHTLLFD